jgi:hypothetical protein
MLQRHRPRGGVRSTAINPPYVATPKKFNLSPLDIFSLWTKFFPIPSLLKGRCRDACSAGRDAAPAGVEGTSLCVIGRPWVSVRAHYGALPLMWLDGDRQRREIAVRQVPGRTDRGLKERRDGTSRGVAVCLCFPAIREISRGRYQGAPFGVPPPSLIEESEVP